MRYTVLVTDDAIHDLDEIYDYVAEHDAPSKADRLIGHVESVFKSLSESPNRGTHPQELLAVGRREFREVFYKPYRVIYRVRDRTVHVLVIADGRREMLTLLQRRLLES